MRHRDQTTLRRLRMVVFSVSLVLLGLATVGLPDGRAQMYYSGGYIQKHRYPPEFPTPQSSATKQTAPRTPPSYFPDNDFAYPSYSPGGEAARPLPSPPGVLPYSISASDLPWNRPDFEDYNETLRIPRSPSVLEPKKYSLLATPLLRAAAAGQTDTAVLIAHLPEHAVFWVEGTRTLSVGRTRYFQSPPLRPGRKYNYRVRAAWIEDGHWVSQIRIVPVQAGMIQAIYLRPSLPPPAKAALNSLRK